MIKQKQKHCRCSLSLKSKMKMKISHTDEIPQIARNESICADKKWMVLARRQAKLFIIFVQIYSINWSKLNSKHNSRALKYCKWRKGKSKWIERNTNSEYSRWCEQQCAIDKSVCGDINFETANSFYQNEKNCMWLERRFFSAKFWRFECSFSNIRRGH